MDEIHVIVPEGAFGEPNEDTLAGLLREITKRVIESLHIEQYYGLGGEYGYGVDYEDDTFMMHQYCWCEKSDCPWCGRCQEEFPSPEHDQGCYQFRLESLKQKHGTKMEWGWHVPVFGRVAKSYARDKKALCKEMGVDYDRGNEIHCTCGAQEDFERLIDACQCDWHLGKGPFRFGAATEAPHFWHKASGLKVRWYKWIGRDMEIDCPEGVDAARILTSLAASHGAVKEE